MNNDMTNQAVFFLNQEDNNFYLYPEAAEKIKRNPAVPYMFLIDENKDIIFRPIEFSEIIYHYCPQQSLYHIVKSKSLWLKNAQNMNDSEEIIWATRKIDELLKNMATIDCTDDFLEKDKEGAINYLIQSDQYTVEVEQEINNRYDKIEKLSLEERNASKNELIPLVSNLLQKNIVENFKPVYISCFCFAGDKLSQWRGYADDGKGLAIGFKTNALMNNQKINLKGVAYHHEQQMGILSNALTKFLGNPETIKDWLIHVLSIFKPHGFKEEEECRLIYVPEENPILNEDFHISTNGIGKHYPFPLSSDCIAEIILGPKNNSNPKDIVIFLKYCGFDIEESQIKKSGLSYR